MESQQIFNESTKIPENNLELKDIYLRAYLKRAKMDGFKHRIAYGYGFVAFLSSNDFETRIKYLDSAIAISKGIDDRHYPIKGYIIKGNSYDEEGQFDKALDNHLKGLEIAKVKKDSFYTAIIKHNIALIKRKIGKYEEAKTIFKEVLVYEKSKSPDNESPSIGYLSTLGELATTYRKNKQIDSAKYFNDLGFIKSKGDTVHCYFLLNQGIIYYYRQEYKNAIEYLESVLNKFFDPKNHYYSEKYNIVDAYLYLAKSYAATSNKEKSIETYKKIDSLIEYTNYINPESRIAYTELINHYKYIDDKNNQLFYINKLLHNDSILNTTLKNVNDQLISDFDTPNLLSEKVRVIQELKSKSNLSIFSSIFLSLILIITTLILLKVYRKNKIYRLRFESIMNEKYQNEKIEPKLYNNSGDSIGITQEIIENILEGLKNFEEESGFREKNITSAILAAKLNTNSKYLTKVIKHYKSKNFSPYINDLRIASIVERLKTDKKLQQYTIKALAQEAGFNSSEVFSKRFYKTLGIYPSYFIKELMKKNS